MKSFTIGIVIVNWNNKTDVLHCINSLKSDGYLDAHRIIVQDNGSTDGSVEEIQKEFPEIEILRSMENLGYAGGNNNGIRQILKGSARFVLILNPDTLVQKGSIEQLVRVMDENRDVGIVGPTILDPDGKVWSRGGYVDRMRYSAGLIGLGEMSENHRSDPDLVGMTKEVDYISGTAMMVRREVFESVGLFHLEYFIYFEDVELCLRAKAAGFRIVLVPSATIDHKESSSFGKNSPAHRYYMARNHMLFVERNAQMSIRMREWIRLPKTLWEHWRKGETSAIVGIRDYFFRRFGRRQ